MTTLNVESIITHLENLGAQVYEHPVVPNHRNIEVVQLRINGVKHICIPSTPQKFQIEWAYVDHAHHAKHVPLWGMLNECAYVMTADTTYSVPTLHVYNHGDVRKYSQPKTDDGILYKEYYHTEIEPLLVASNKDLSAWVKYLRRRVQEDLLNG